MKFYRIPPLSEEATHRLTLALAFVALGLVLGLHLVGALFGGLLVHEVVHALAPRMLFVARGRVRARAMSVGIIAALVIGVLVGLGFLGLHFFRTEAASPAVLLARMADILDASRARLPPWIVQHLPPDAEALRAAVSGWMRAHAHDLELAGRSVGMGLVHVLIGMVIGAIISFREAAAGAGETLFLREASARVATLAGAFRGVVFAQVKISLLNTSLTAVYLLIVLPLAGVHLPFTKTLVVVTFVAGLLPVFGNLISNTVILIISLSVSLGVAAASLAYLVVIHKLEYFLNARIVGAEIKASAWELLCAMLVMEAAFGLPGLVAAPIYYAYLKSELRTLAVI